MNLQVKWTLAALQSLSDVLDYTFEQFGERQLRKLTKRINSSVLRISFFPKTGKPEPYVSELVGADFRSVVVIKKIKLYYTVNREIMFVEFIKNTNMDDSTMLKKLQLS